MNGGQKTSFSGFSGVFSKRVFFGGGGGWRPWDELIGRAFGAVLGVNHEEHVGESGAEIGAVGVVVARGFGGVDVHAFGAVELHHGLPGDVR